MNKLNRRIEESRLSNGKLPMFTSVGSYPLLYLTKDNSCLCASCVDQLDPELESDMGDITAHVNWEQPLWCDDCGVEIESAYGGHDD